MRKMQWVLLCILGTSVACAQSAKDAVAALQSSIGNSQLVLKNFSGENKVLATWSGTQWDLAPARWHTMGVLQLTSTKLKGQKLTLQFVRQVLLKDAQDKLALSPEVANVQVEVDLQNADPVTVLPKLRDDLFFPSVEDAVSAIPKGWKIAVPAKVDKAPRPERAALTTSQPVCDCADKENSACDAVKGRRQGMVPPKALKVKDPDFPDSARKGLVDAHVLVAMVVDKSGHPSDVWVLRSAGMGLDEEAAKATLDYVFRPAMCHESPVSVYLNVDVRFQRY